MKVIVSNKRSFKLDRIVFCAPLGIGDFLFAVGAIEKLSDQKKVYILTTKHIWKNVSEFFEPDFRGQPIFIDNLATNQRIQDIAKKEARNLRAGVIYFGFEALWLSQKLRPDLGLNQHYYRITGSDFGLAIRPKTYNERLRNVEQVIPPDHEYNFIHDFPNTNRQLSKNQMEVPYVHADAYKSFRLVQLLDLARNADEIHVVNSSIYCLLVVTGVFANRNCLYLMKYNYLISNTESPKGWEEFNLFDRFGEELRVPEIVDRKRHLTRTAGLAKNTPRRILNKVFFGKYGSFWNPIIKDKI
jgi:hypothetical protein